MCYSNNICCIILTSKYFNNLYTFKGKKCNIINFILFQTWFYNQSIYNLNTGQNYLYNWMEYDAERGSDEIGSCLYHWIYKMWFSKEKPQFSRLRVFMDNCAGRTYFSILCIICNKLNIFIIVFLLVIFFNSIH